MKLEFFTSLLQENFIISAWTIHDSQKRLNPGN